MKKICFLSCEKMQGFVSDDELLSNELKNVHNFEIETIPWNHETDWSRFDLVLIRTTWDYFERPVEFLNKLKLIESQTKLTHPTSIVEWNMHKVYLLDLEKKGIKIVPTVIFKGWEQVKLPEADKIIVKPAISAGSFKTQVMSKSEFKAVNFKDGDWLVQPFLEEIKHGEISLIFFEGIFSHAIKKTPLPHDFRVQEEFGGEITPLIPEKELMALGEKILSNIRYKTLYARVDLVRVQGEYLLMELELIEPSLYFRTDPHSTARLCSALKKELSHK